MSNIVYNAAFTPEKIAENKKKLNIPIYQRLFVWEEEQINLLLDDLNRAFEKSKEKPYYIGIITVVENNGMWDVVDGQQRLTFLSLFGACCCKIDSDWKKFLYTEAEKEESENLRIDYMGRPEDREDLKEIASGNFANVCNPNFNLFMECINKKFQNSIPKDFANYVYQKASFLVSELPENYTPADLNLFFEKMNATGKQLTAVEQIKGKYFPASAACFDACLNFEKKFEWQEENGIENKNGNKTLIDILNDTSIKVNTESAGKTSDATRRSILSPEVFLLHCLKILKQENVLHNEREILETFKTHVASEGENKIKPDDFLNTMKEYRTWLDNNIIYLKAAPDGSWEYTLRKEDDEQKEYEDQAKKESDVDVNIRLKLKQFQSMLYVSSSNYQEWVLDAFETTKTSAKREANTSKEWVLDAFETTKTGPKEFLDLLKLQDATRHTLDSKAMTYQSIDRYWFWKLDYLLWEKFMDDENQVKNYELHEDEKTAIRNYKFRRNRSIEHLHPQTDDGSWKDAEKHQFGNLAMISSSFNSAQQNDSVGIKFQRLKEVQLRNNNLESIKLLLMFKLAGGQESGWTINAMKNHESEMFNLLGIQKNNC